MTDSITDTVTGKAESAIPALSPDNNQTISQAIASAAADCYGLISEVAGNRYVQVAAAGAAALGLIALTRGRAAVSAVDELAGATNKATSIGFDSLGGEFHGPVPFSNEVAGGGRWALPEIDDLHGGWPSSLSLRYVGVRVVPALETAARAAEEGGFEISEKATGGVAAATHAAEKALPVGLTDLGGSLDGITLESYKAGTAAHPPTSSLADAFRFLTEGSPASTRSLSLQFPGTTQSDSAFSDLARRAVARGIELSTRNPAR